MIERIKCFLIENNVFFDRENREFLDRENRVFFDRENNVFFDIRENQRIECFLIEASKEKKERNKPLM